MNRFTDNAAMALFAACKNFVKAADSSEAYKVPPAAYRELKEALFEAQKLPEADPEVTEWLENVTDAVYDQCTEIQKAIPAFRAMGTRGKMLIWKALNESEKHG